MGSAHVRSDVADEAPNDDALDELLMKLIF